MTSEDVSSVLALINKWSSQFEIRQVQCLIVKKKIFCQFLLHTFVFTYVVEDKPKNVTALVSHVQYDMPHIVVHIDTVVSTQSPVKQLITDALVCARENGVVAAVISQRNMESDISTSLSFQPYDHDIVHFYNYRYHEISQAKVVIFPRC